MNKNRLEAFSDGVLAIIITIMVLDIKIPQGADYRSLSHDIPKFLSYVISFVYIAIYWNNHHHLIHTVRKVRGSILWANMHLLFWLSIVPIVTGWAGQSHFAELPVAAYAFVMFMAAVAYFILSKVIIAVHGKDSELFSAIGNDYKGIVSLLSYAISIPLAFYIPIASVIIIALVAVIWFLPDRRIERNLIDKE